MEKYLTRGNSLAAYSTAKQRFYNGCAPAKNYAIDDIELIAGSLPKRQHRLIEAWAEIHQEELLSDWERLQGGQPPLPIEPLK